MLRRCKSPYREGKILAELMRKDERLLRMADTRGLY